VRHRAGTAFSQESLRYVRLTDLGAYFPDAFREHDTGGSQTSDDNVFADAYREFCDVFEYAEKVQKELARIHDIDNMKDFKAKKKLTSAFRRLAPIGLTTAIVVTANHRAWRHIISMRCSEHAEEEICKVIRMVAEQLKQAYPNIYQDMTLNEDGTVTFENPKV
jgi:thymidylate synthase (FAD)